MKGNEEISIIMKLEPSAAHHKNKITKTILVPMEGSQSLGMNRKTNAFGIAQIVTDNLKKPGP